MLKLPFVRNLSLENSSDSYLCFPLALLYSVCYFFSLYWPPSWSLCMVFGSNSSNIDEVSRSTHLLMFSSLEALTSIIRTGLLILVELIDLVNSLIIFLSQMTLLRWLTFLLQSLVFQIVGRFHQCSLFLRMVGKGLQRKTTALLVFFL